MPGRSDGGSDAWGGVPRRREKNIGTAAGRVRQFGRSDYRGKGVEERSDVRARLRLPVGEREVKESQESADARCGSDSSSAGASRDRMDSLELRIEEIARHLGHSGAGEAYVKLTERQRMFEDRIIAMTLENHEEQRGIQGAVRDLRAQVERMTGMEARMDEKLLVALKASIEAMVGQTAELKVAFTSKAKGGKKEVAEVSEDDYSGIPDFRNDERKAGKKGKATCLGRSATMQEGGLEPKRVGEASNPGPEKILFSANPSSVRGKMLDILEHSEEGTWGIQETHLDQMGQRTMTRQCRMEGWTAVWGEPVTPDQKYAGVGMVSKDPVREEAGLSEQFRRTGRCMITRWTPGDEDWLVGNVYGFPQSGDYPDAIKRTNEILRHVVAGLKKAAPGPKVIIGDFNCNLDQLREYAELRSHGWIEAGWLQLQRTGVIAANTCKGATRRDYIVLDPKAQEKYRGYVQLYSVFPDHTPIGVRLEIGRERPFQAWRMPKVIDLGQISEAYEKAADYALKMEGLDGLSDLQQGRGATMHPTVRMPSQRVKAARNDEKNNLPATAHGVTRVSVRQLRRLQTIVQLVRNNSDTSRIEAISQWWSFVRFGGLGQDFRTWWRDEMVPQVNGRQRRNGDTRMYEVVEEIPWCLPDADTAAQMRDTMTEYVGMLENRDRGSNAKGRNENERPWEFGWMKEPGMRELTMVRTDREMECRVSAGDEDFAHFVVPQDGIEAGSHLSGEDGWHEVLVASGDFVQGAPSFKTGLTSLRASTWHSHPEDATVQYEAVWNPRWQRHREVEEGRWDEIIEKVRPLMPRHHMDIEKITKEVWRQRLGKTRAQTMRGLDGFSIQDLKDMPDPLLDELLERQRPITVFGLIYRTWSGIRSKQAPAWLATWLPATCAGFVPGRSAEDVWMSIQLEVEIAVQNHEPIGGAVADVVKCFNCLPRGLVLALATHIGVPNRIMVPWGSVLTGLRRRFRHRGAVGRSLQSWTGFPEGCGLSCVAMIVVDMMLDVYLGTQIPTAVVWTYADNWEATSGVLEDLPCIAKALGEFARMLDLELDQAKSWLWATDVDWRNKLRKNQEHGWVTKLHARDLGGHMNYARARYNGTLQERVRLTLARLAKLACSGSAYARKLRVIPTGCWSKAMHGAEALIVGQQVIQALRTGAMRALKASQPQASPLVLLSLVENPMNDPEAYMTWRRVWKLRRFFWCEENRGKLTEYILDDFGRLGAGPAKVILDTMECLKWTIAADLMITDEKGARYATIAVYAKASEMARGVLRATFTGANVANKQKARWDVTKTEACECGELDSVEHRALRCRLTQVFRENSNLDWNWILEQPESLRRFGLATLPAFAAHSLDCRITFRRLGHTPREADGDRQTMVFTDGTGQWPKLPRWRLTGYSVTIAEPDTRENRLVERSAFPLELHTVPRAESFALLRTPQLVWWPLMHCDCQYAVDVMQCLIDGKELDWASTDNVDIWKLVKVELEIPNRPRPGVKKVAAHTFVEEADTAWKKWARHHNGCADEHAKDSLKEDQKELMRERSGVVEKYLSHCEQVGYYQNLLVDTNLYFIQEEEKAGKRKGLVKLEMNEIANENVVYVECKLNLASEQMNEFGQGSEFAGRLICWWNSLRWSENEMLGYEGVTWIQLLVDFMMHSGTRPPVDLNPDRKKKRTGGRNWKLADESQEARMQVVTTIGEMRTFRQAMEAFAGIRRKVILTEQAEVAAVLTSPGSARSLPRFGLPFAKMGSLRASDLHPPFPYESVSRAACRSLRLRVLPLSVPQRKPSPVLVRSLASCPAGDSEPLELRIRSLETDLCALSRSAWESEAALGRALRGLGAELAAEGQERREAVCLFVVFECLFVCLFV
ncbi:unnamed protein product, partial [Polarella glacialis]